MREISSSIAFEIRTGETIPMKVARSTKLVVHGGAVWVTRSDDTEDYWLQPGHTLRLRRGERLWLSAEGSTHAKVAFSAGRRTAGGPHAGGLAHGMKALRCRACHSGPAPS
jgi:hypothetical protein